MSGEIISFTQAAERLASLDVDIVEVRAPSNAALAEQVSGALRFREGDDVQVIYRAAEGRAEIRSVMYGPNNFEVARALCRTLGRTASEIVATPAGDPRPFDLTWVEIAAGQPGAGLRLARVRGVSAVQLNMALGHPIVRIEHNHTSGRATALSAPLMAEQAAPAIDAGDDE